MAVDTCNLTTMQVRARLDNYVGNMGTEPMLLNRGEEGFQIGFLVLDPQLGPDVVSVKIDGAFPPGSENFRVGSSIPIFGTKKMQQEERIGRLFD